MTRRPSLLLALELPDAISVAVTSLVARLARGMTPLALVLFVERATGSYASAGAVVGCSALADAAASPFQARLVDRFGSARILLPCASLNAVALVLFATAAESQLTALLVLGGVAGAVFPPISGRTKVVWAAIAGGDNLRHAYALESLLQQVSFLAGPLLAVGMVAVASPAGALIAVVGLTLVGTVGFVVASTGYGTPSVAGARHPLGRLAIKGIVALAVTTLLQNILFGVLTVAVPAFATGHGHPLTAGPLLAVTNVGAILGGLTLAPRIRQGSEASRYLVLSALIAAATAQLFFASSVIVLGAVLFSVGLLISPTATVSYLLLSRLTPLHAQTEVFTWISTAVAAGSAVGAAVGGAVTQHSGPSQAFTLAVGSTAVAAIVAYVCRRPIAVAP